MFMGFMNVAEVEPGNEGGQKQAKVENKAGAAQ
jgi:hypothetical protein